MKLIIISSPQHIPDEATIINQLFDEGLECFHLRKPEDTVSTVERLLLQIKTHNYSKIALHQFHHLAEEFGMNRLHYTRQARGMSDKYQWQVQKEQGCILSTSIHDIASLQQISACFDYVFLSPVFNSISKKGYNSMLPENFFLQQTDKRVPVVALGGIEATNIEKVKRMNFDGAALLGSIWSNQHRAVGEFKLIKLLC